MQSRINCDFKIRTYFASWQDMGAFAKFVKRIEEECKDECAAKIVPPARFNAYSKCVDKNTVLSNVIVQNSEKIGTKYGAVYEISNEVRRKMTYENFVKQMKNNDDVCKSDRAMEGLAWQQLASNALTTYYSVDNDMSLFGDRCDRMNLNKFTRAESLLHQGSVQLGGIHTPFTYFGSHMSYFGLHLEEANLNSINFLHAGERKIWYFIPESENVKLENLANDVGRMVNTTCVNFIRHKSLMIPPAVLRQHGIKFGRVVQRPNEYILSFSGGYHAGFNCGLNQAEAINFGSERWLKFFPEYLACRCAIDQEVFMRKVKKVISDIYLLEAEKLRKSTSFICDICDGNMSSRHAMYRHMKTKHLAVLTKYKCSACGALFSTRVNSRKHMKSKHGLDMDTTEEIRVNNTSLRKKKNAFGRRERAALSCEKCKLVIHGGYELKRHMRYKHGAGNAKK